VHAAETADIAALSGRHAAAHIAAALSGQAEPGSTGPDPAVLVPVEVEPPLAWISPSAIRFPAGDAATAPPRGRFVLRSRAFARRAHLEVRQGDRVLARTRTRLIPSRSVTLESGWLTRVQPSGGPIRVRVI
jgi:hypothetical protein